MMRCQSDNLPLALDELALMGCRSWSRRLEVTWRKTCSVAAGTNRR